MVAKAWVAIADWEAAQAELYPAILDRLRREGIGPFGSPAPKAA